MSDLVINDVISKEFNFPYGHSYVPFNTPIKNAVGSVRQTFEHQDHDFMTYSLNLNHLNAADRRSMFEFVLKHGGNADSFLLKDVYGFGYEVARQSIGTGDGAEDEFQLIETVGDYDYERWDIIAASVSVWVNNAAQTEGGGNDYTLDYTSSGLITFNAGSIPANTHDVEAQFEYYRRCRFIAGYNASLPSYNNTVLPLVFEEEAVA